MALARAHVIISGDVQGVGFRYSTRSQAQRLELTGWVKNRPDGTVEAVFEGERDVVEQMVQWCHRGPSGAYVTDVRVTWGEATGQYREFGIAFR